MSAYKTPGVYIEDVPQIVLSIADIKTAIPAFIGYTQISNKQGRTITPVRITTMIEYTTMFGTTGYTDIDVFIKDTVNNGIVTSRNVTAEVAEPKFVMYYQMQLYFDNGGGPCYIVSLGTEDSTPAYTDFTAGLAAIELQDEPTLLVFPDATRTLLQPPPGSPLAPLLPANMDATDLYKIYDAAMAQAAKLKDRFVIMDASHSDAPSAPLEVETFRNGISQQNLKYGAAYFPLLKTALGYNFSDATIHIEHMYVNNTGAHLGIDNYDANDIPDYILGNVLIDKAAVYQAARQAAADFRITLNPSPAVAGVYVATDNSRGVWKAPANVSLNSVNGLAVPVSEELQSSLNIDANAGKSVNAMRAFPGKGVVVWGARTLAGNDNEWRYVPVRRLFNMIEEAIGESIEAFVFETNDANTWVKVKSLIYNYLTGLWKAGAMQGTSEDEAFYVAVGLGETMNAQDILEGRMIVEIGIAAVRPAEFIVVRFSHSMAES